MKYFATMITKLVDDEFTLEDDEKAELKSEMKKSMKASEDSQNKFMRIFNNLMKHPAGILLSILGYTHIKRTISRINMETNSLSAEDAFKQELTQKIYKDILEK